MTGPLSAAAPLDVFMTPRGKARGAFFWGGIVTGFGTLVVACTIAILTAAYLMAASFDASRKTSTEEASKANTTIVAKRVVASGNTAYSIAPVAIPDDEGGAFSSIFDASPPPVFSSASLAAQNSMPGSAGRLSSLLSASLVSPDVLPDMKVAGSYQKNPARSIASDFPDGPPLPRPRKPYERAIETSSQPVVLASAQPEIPDGIGASIPQAPVALPDSRSHTALYDIEAHTVYLPNGDKLEAHSGLGDRLDDTRYVHEKNRGPTPPHVYDLRLRESLFHGVQAVRLTPVGGTNPFGRTGLLAHSYMLGPRGDSNGCVSFKDYPKFLNAVSKGEVTRLVVVKRLKDAPPVVASTGLGSLLRYAFGSL